MRPRGSGGSCRSPADPAAAPDAALDQLRDMFVDWRSETDIFDALSLHGQEEFHSDFLAWLLDP